MKKGLIILIIIAAAAGVVFALQDRTEPAPAPTPSPPAPAGDSPGGEAGEEGVEEPSRVVITYTDSGYSQTEISVKAGTAIIFRNESSTAFWPASNVHPIHLEFPDFDARRPYSPGESYFFTFNEPGIYDFHDHLRPNRGGTITVE